MNNTLDFVLCDNCEYAKKQEITADLTTHIVCILNPPVAFVIPTQQGPVNITLSPDVTGDGNGCHQGALKIKLAN